MRGTVEHLASPYPLQTLLPSVLQDDEFAVRFTSGLDDILAAIISTIDCLSAYVDPMLAPVDFLAWLSRWPGEPLSENWPEQTKRLAIASGIERQRHRGTIDGLRDYLALLTGGDVAVSDHAGATWSLTPGGDRAVAGSPHVVVEIAVDDPDQLDEKELNRIIRESKPAHVAHSLTVRAR